MKVYAVVYHDYEEHTTKYVCATKERAEDMAKELTAREYMFNPKYKNMTPEYLKDLLPRYVVNEFDLIDSDFVIPIPKYISVSVTYVDQGIELSDRLKIQSSLDSSCMHFDRYTLPEFSKDIIIVVFSSLEATSEDINGIDFNMFLPVIANDNIDDLKAKIVHLVTDILNELSQKGHPLSYLLHTNVFNFNPDIFDIEEHGAFRLGVTRFPNPLMQDVNIE